MRRMDNRPTTVLYWFRKALRMHDNPALLRARAVASASENARMILVFVLDPVFLQPQQYRGNGDDSSLAGNGIGRCGYIPLRFLCESLVDLHQSIRKLNRNQQLVLLEGSPVEIFPKLWKEYQVTHLMFEEEEVEPYGRKRDAIVASLAEANQIVVETAASHSLFPMKQYSERRPSSYQTFLHEFEQLGGVPLPQAAPESLPPAPDRMPHSRSCWDIVGIQPDFESPGYAWFPGGEAESLKRLAKRVEANPNWVKRFSKPDSSPCQLQPGPSTTALSPYLTFGCLSARKFWRALDEAERKESSGPTTTPPESLKGQLLWREHFYLQAYHVGEPFDRMEGNPICKQIPWNTWEKGRNPCSPKSKAHLEAFTRWKEGKTGHPFIDACMRQLVQVGWMHHLARHAVACFVTRGDLFIHWEHARDVFSEYLVDGDWALNNANWMWLSCSSFFYQYFRVYGPESFPKKYDPNGDFVRKFVPELQNFPKQYIYTPWKAPLVVQKRCGCIVGKDYPAPLVPDHDSTSKRNIQIIQAAYEATSTSSSRAATRDGKRVKETGLKNPPAGKRARHSQ